MEADKLADSDTLCPIASCSKLLTSPAVAILTENYGVSWDGLIHKHLPDFDPAEDPEIAKKATLADTARHTTGLATRNATFIGPQGKLTVKSSDFLKMINNFPTANSLAQRFRNLWNYSNAAFGLLAKVVESVTGTTFAKFLQQTILTPLGITQTTVTRADLECNDNVTHPFYAKSDGGWGRIPSGITTDEHAPVLAFMGMRSSVNDLFSSAAAVRERYDLEEGIKHAQKANTSAKISSENPLTGVAELWNQWWTRPHDDGFDNDNVYTTGWVRTRMPSSALGMTPYSRERRTEDVIGKESQPRWVYGHSGLLNGVVATFYVLPESYSAVVVMSNAANPGDALETASQMLLQAFFNLKPKVDLIRALRGSQQHFSKEYQKMVNDRTRNRDIG